MIARKELLESYEVAETFAHFLPVHGYHVVVHPIANHLIALRSHGLRYLAFVVGEYEVETASMNVEMVSEIFSAHCGALGVPSRESVAPWRGPAHYMFGLRFLP